ncbi:NAD-dependent epimerase/dehydratase family protein [Rhizobium sp. P38BS-XIX]|uniref:NAD-dependent epimerase/dehydratase family protein n=1 Tax=Rhizobium sp. P38BS-XIX TaxID=2726740 RepID=UPI001456F7D5|nr:aldehyde reductase [Rhizobium sp. P38BS-XIX]NLR99889.1 NAD-dependent epimerase/dehydratase family protein [Rhizobium sp. P38BS-XIX]
MNELVLVTGGTGFIAQHCMIALFSAGYRVRTTVRSLSREDEVRAHLKIGGVEPGDRLSFAVTNLDSDDGWAAAAESCTYAFHGASPTPSGDQQSEDDWVRPAVDGNLRVLRAARDAKLKRVVLTSAFGAIGAGQKALGRAFVETDWSDLNGDIAPYQKSKTLAERASWDFIASEGRGLELASVNPTMVLGPALGPDISHSIRTIKQMLDGQPGYPRIKTCVVDVRDVADLHVRAMIDPAANGERFLATSGQSLWMVEIAEVLKQRLGDLAKNVSTQVLPNEAIEQAALNIPAMKALLPLLDVDLNASGEKAQRVLGWSPRSREDAILASAESLVRLGIVKAND